jgi:hypothetical protein
MTILNEKLNDDVVKTPITTTTAPTTTTTTPAETSSVSIPVTSNSPTVNSFSTEINKILENLSKPSKSNNKKHYTKVPLIEASNMDNKQPTVVEHIKMENPATTAPELPILLTEPIVDAESLPILLDQDSKTEIVPSKLENIFLIENMHILKPSDSIEIDSTALPLLLDTSFNTIEDSSTIIAEEVQKDEKVFDTTIKPIEDDLSEEESEEDFTETTTLGKVEEVYTIEHNDLDNEIEQITDKSS